MPRPSETVSVPAADAADASPRIKRNTACVQCRDAKVKCNASLNPGHPCLRCTKLDLPCVIDKSHKRTTRRSKLEELAQEVRTIKEAVAPRNPQGTQGEFPSVQPGEPPSPICPALPPQGPSSLLSTTSTAYNPPRAYPGPAEVPVLTPSLTSQSTSTPISARQSQPRALACRVFSSEDIDFYFEKYFEHFHPYFPVIRVRDPDTCYKTGPVLFWAVIATACRRYARDPTVFQFLVDTIASEIWKDLSNPPLRHPAINALLLMSTWPLPTVRFLTDPSSIYSTLAMNSCFVIGLHTGKGRHPAFQVPQHSLESTDEEATYTWAGSLIINSRISTYTGFPSLAPINSKTIDRLLDGSAPFSVSQHFAIQIAATRFSDRVNRMMAATLEDAQGVSHHLVSQLEEEFSETQRLLYPDNADLDNFTLLITLLEIQIYYFIPLPGHSLDVLKRNILRCYSTSQSVIRQALKLEREMGFLRHAPHFVFRSVLAATCVIVSVLLSTYMAGRVGPDEDTLMAEATLALRRCSVQEGDLPQRATRILESYWGIRHLVPVSDAGNMGVSLFSHRLGASLAFDCLRRWKRHMDLVRPMPSQPVHEAQDAQEAAEVPGAAGPNGQNIQSSQNGDLVMVDPFQIDWNSFMDDFDWSFTANVFDVPQI